MKTIKNILLYVWQLPQNLLGLILVVCFKAVPAYKVRGCGVYISERFTGGISLGRYVILKKSTPISIKHELGHCKQSKILGWVYLIVVGLPSFFHAWQHGNWCHDENYYHFWTERWADKLGGVTHK